ncbi:MAG: hypothetical protein IIW86_05700 [Clostridia bacterium]|nr:hypothetical protein [Clostridia bacterium]
MKEIFLILAALAGAPEPAPTYRAPIGGETAAAMLDTIINNGGEAPAEPAEDFNGDGVLNIADYCGSSRRFYINIHDGAQVTIDAATVEAIAAELYPDDINNYFYYEFDMINGDLCREYEATADEITTARIYFEFEDWSTTHRAEINPYTETITIFKEA